MTPEPSLKERLFAVMEDGDKRGMPEEMWLLQEAYYEIKRLEAELEQRDIAVKARAWDKNDEKNDEIARLRAERDEAVGPDMYAVVEKVAELNPDAGEIGPGMLATIVADARAARARARHTEGEQE